MKFYSFIFVITALFGATLNAAPLGTFPTIIEGKTRATLEIQSDVWTSPYRSKKAPLRRYLAQVKSPLLNTKRWIASAHLEIEGLNLSRTDIAIGHDNLYIGNELRHQSIGVGMARRGDNKRWSQIYFGYESSSDKPFSHPDHSTPEIVALHAFPSPTKFQGVVGVDYSKNRGFLNDRPLPLLGTIYDFSTHLKILFGFPFLQIRYTNDPNWEGLLKLTPVIFSAEINRRLNEIMWVGLQSGAYARSYMHSDRGHNEDRLFFHEKFFSLSLKTMLSQKTSFSVSTGYSFNRTVYEASEVFNYKSDHHRFDSDFYISTAIEFLL